MLRLERGFRLPPLPRSTIVCSKPLSWPSPSSCQSFMPSVDIAIIKEGTDFPESTVLKSGAIDLTDVNVSPSFIRYDGKSRLNATSRQQHIVESEQSRVNRCGVLDLKESSKFIGSFLDPHY